MRLSGRTVLLAVSVIAVPTVALSRVFVSEGRGARLSAGAEDGHVIKLGYRGELAPGELLSLAGPTLCTTGDAIVIQSVGLVKAQGGLRVESWRIYPLPDGGPVQEAGLVGSRFPPVHGEATAPFARVTGLCEGTAGGAPQADSSTGGNSEATGRYSQLDVTLMRDSAGSATTEGLIVTYKIEGRRFLNGGNRTLEIPWGYSLCVPTDSTSDACRRE